MKKYALDTSVVIKWFSKDEEDAEHANKLRRQIQDGLCDIIIPDLLFYELANALRHNPNFTAEDVQVSLDSVFDMDFEVRKVDNSVIASAIGIAFKFNVTVYDAYFLALSQLESKNMAIKKLPDKCPLCGGNKKKGKTIFTVDLGFGVVVIRDVPATVCSQCGADWIEDAIASKLEEIVNDARLKRHIVEVTTLST